MAVSSENDLNRQISGIFEKNTKNMKKDKKKTNDTTND